MVLGSRAARVMAGVCGGERYRAARAARAKCRVGAARVHGRKGIDDECYK